jgi:hypothetical protein
VINRLLNWGVSYEIVIAGEYCGKIADGDLNKMLETGAEGREKTKKIKRMLRFICPSNYLPGKEEG